MTALIGSLFISFFFIYLWIIYLFLYFILFYLIFFCNNCTLSASYYCLYFVASDTYVVDKINHSSYKWLIAIIYRGIALECGTCMKCAFFHGFVQSVPLTNQNMRLVRSFRRSRRSFDEYIPFFFFY